MMSLPEEDLSCPICFDIFTDPVLLSCSHSFCRSCVKRCWETSSLRECPVCRKKASRSSPPSNRALKNLCEAHVKNRRHSLGKEVIVCDLHGEQFKLFCLVDMQPICVVCQSSKLHKDHDCVPIEETTLDCKDEVCTTLENLQDQLKKLSRIQENSGVILSHIKNQALETQRLIRNQFEQLHQALHDEESVKLAALKMEAEEKITAMQDKMSETAAEILCLTETIQTLEEKLRADDMIYTQNFKATLERGNSMKHGSENMPGALIDVSKHLCNLKYRIWEKMHDHLQYTPLTLDPNTAHPCLILSDDLTSLHYSSQPLCFPNNPERFHVSAEVVGTTALGSGSHRWIVETGNNHDWLLGVASASAPRDVEVSARPENGFWTLCLRDGELRAMTSPPTALAVTRKPCQVKVKLDYDKGTVSFFDSADDTVLYSFTHKFTETLLPYFYTQSTYPLKILPENVLCVTKLHR